VLENSDGTTSPHNFSGPPIVVIDFLAQDVGNAGGSNQQIQFNNNGNLAGMSGSKWDDPNTTWTFTDVNGNIQVNKGSFIIFAQQVGNGGGVFNGILGDFQSRVALTMDGNGVLFLGFGGGSSFRDTFLYRDAAAIFAQRNGVNAQTKRVYNTTDSTITNYERGIFDWKTIANVLTIGTEKGGTGFIRNIAIEPGNTAGSNGQVWINFGGTAPPNGQGAGPDSLSIACYSNSVLGGYRYANTNFGCSFTLAHSRSGTVGILGALSVDDIIGQFVFNADDGVSGFQTAATISGRVDAAVSSGTVPGRIVFKTTNTSAVLNEVGRMDRNGNFVWNTAALATSATDGFIYIPTCAGAPTGTPTSYAGRASIVYDTTNNKLWVYNGAWKGALFS
jgi:hypothetical protein